MTARPGFVERQAGDGTIVEVPVGVDGVNPATAENPLLAQIVTSVAPEDQFTIAPHQPGIDYANEEVQAALRGEEVGDLDSVLRLRDKTPWVTADAASDIPGPDEQELEEDVLLVRQREEAERLATPEQKADAEKALAEAEAAEKKAADVVKAKASKPAPEQSNEESA